MASSPRVETLPLDRRQFNQSHLQSADPSTQRRRSALTAPHRTHAHLAAVAERAQAGDNGGTASSSLGLLIGKSPAKPSRLIQGAGREEEAKTQERLLVGTAVRYLAYLTQAQSSAPHPSQTRSHVLTVLAPNLGIIMVPAPLTLHY